MKKTTNTLTTLLIALFATTITNSCDLIDYHPYDTRVDGKHNINATNIERIETACTGRTALRFVLISDTQRWYDETKDAVKSINAQPDVDFVIHCGDISDFGVTREFTLQRDILEDLKMPYVVLLGNHDCLGTGADTFRYVFGDPNFAFNAGNTHFLCINSNAFEYDYSTDVPDFAFISNDRENLPDDITRTIVAMHAQPTSEQFNNNVSHLFQWEINKYPGLAFCLCGHGHKTQSNDLFGDGILYYECGAAKSREYLIFTLNTDGSYEHQVVNY
ncbi:MAG: metallophosphoesterase family protein [Muribaculaceae bacterium]